MSDLNVTLIGPAKIDGLLFGVGARLVVPFGLARQLAEAGAIPPLDEGERPQPAPLVIGAPAEDAGAAALERALRAEEIGAALASQLAAAKAEADTARTSLFDAREEIAALNDDIIWRATAIAERDAQLAAAHARIAELETAAAEPAADPAPGPATGAEGEPAVDPEAAEDPPANEG